MWQRLYLWLFLCLTFVLHGQKDTFRIQMAQDTIFGVIDHAKITIEQPYLFIIVPGSGPTDRNGNNGSMISNTYAALGDSLSTHGFDVFRYDKRGIGNSTLHAGVESVKSIDTFIQDIVRITKALKKPYEDHKIVLLGHSQGGLLATIAAQKTDIDGLILACSAGQKLKQILIDQFEVYPRLLPYMKSYLDSIEQGYEVQNVHPMVRMMMPESLEGYMKSWMDLDPIEELRKVDLPILVLHGEHDIQAAEAEFLAFQQLDHIDLIEIDSMNHVLRLAPKDRFKNIATYSDPLLPISAEFLQHIIKFCKEN